MKSFALLLLTCLAFSTASADPVIVIVRHAEKSGGTGNDPDLSDAGKKRAAILAEMFKNAGITAVFVSEFRRTQETAAPFAKSAGIDTAIIPAKNTAALVAKLGELSGNALVVSHGNTIPDLVKGLGVETPINIPDNDYTDIFIVVRSNPPQLLRLRYPF